MNSISNYNFEDSDKLFGYKHRVNITMSSGKVYNIAAEEDVEKLFLPKCLRKIFWAKVHLFDQDGNSKTFFVNRNSLAKRTGTSDSLTKFALKMGKKDQSFDSAMKILHKADKIAESMVNDYWLRSRQLQKTGEIVKIIEKNKADYRERAESEGGFVEKRKGHTFVVRIDPKDPNKTNFYIKQAKLIGKGGFKKVHSLLDYESEKPKYALSIQKLNKRHPEDMDYPRKGFEITSRLKNSKNIMQGELLYEDGVTRNADGNIEKVNKNASVYLVTKLYKGTFAKIAKSKNFTLKDKLIVFSDILQGVSDMHAKNIVHCDLKNANVLYKMKDGKLKIKIIDTDLSRSFEARIANHSSPGTPHYKAPEALGRHAITHPDKLDSWSLGVMLYEVCEGKPAYFKKQEEASREDWEAVVSTGVQNLQFKNLNDDSALRAIIIGLLNVDPALRLSVDDAKQALDAFIESM